MKSTSSALVLIIILSVVFFAFGTVGCDINGDSFDVSGHENNETISSDTLSTAEDIKNLVTDDYKLVINYYDAYVWVVYFNDEGDIDHMMYIYDFETSEDANSMLDTRKAELEINKTMTVISAESIDNYIIIDLLDTSFKGVTRQMLENNFSQLIVK